MARQELFIIDETPEVQARPRVTKWGTYDPKREKKLWVKSILKEKMEGKELFSGPIDIEITFGMPIPKTAPKYVQYAMKKDLIQHCKSCDLDNLIKFLWDAMNGVVFEDDRLISSCKAVKKYMESPKTVIYIKSYPVWDNEELKLAFKNKSMPIAEKK